MGLGLGLDLRVGGGIEHLTVLIMMYQDESEEGEQAWFISRGGLHRPQW